MNPVLLFQDTHNPEHLLCLREEFNQKYNKKLTNDMFESLLFMYKRALKNLPSKEAIFEEINTNAENFHSIMGITILNQLSENTKPKEFLRFLENTKEFVLAVYPEIRKP